MSALATVAQRLGRTGIVLATVVLAVVVNLLLYGLGALAGGTYDFTSQGAPARVDALTLVGFTAVPLVVGMTAAAVLSRWWRWVIPVALTIALVLAVGSVPVMPLATELDAPSKVALSATHVALGAIAALGLLALRARAPQPVARKVTA